MIKRRGENIVAIIPKGIKFDPIVGSMSVRETAGCKWLWFKYHANGGVAGMQINTDQIVRLNENADIKQYAIELLTVSR